MKRANDTSEFLNSKAQSFKAKQNFRTNYDMNLEQLKAVILLKQKNQRVNKCILLQHENKGQTHTLGSTQHSTLMCRRSSSNMSSPISTGSLGKNLNQNKEGTRSDQNDNCNQIHASAQSKNRFVDLIDQRDISFQEKNVQKELKIFWSYRIKKFLFSEIFIVGIIIFIFVLVTRMYESLQI